MARTKPRHLLSNDRLLRVLWAKSVNGLCLVDEEGNVVEANPAMCRMLEYTKDELRGMHFSKITSPQDLSTDSAMSEAVARGEEPGYVMWKTYITKRSMPLPAHLKVVAIREKDGGDFVCFLSQITPSNSPANPIPAQEGKSAPSKAIMANEFGAFMRDNWKWILPAGSAVFYAFQWVIEKVILLAKAAGS